MGMQDPKKFTFRELEPIVFGPMRVEHATVKEINELGVVMEDSWYWPRDCFPANTLVGDQFLLGTVKASMPCYVARVSGTGLVSEFWHRTETDLSAERNKRHQDSWVKKLQAYEENKHKYWARELELPQVLQSRLDNFRSHTPNFDVEGWLYELMVSELSVLYLNSINEIVDWTAFEEDQERPDIENEATSEYASTHGTSGNQHGCAKALAWAMFEGPENDEAVRTSLAAMYPLGVGSHWQNV